jgi:hypothetical protein
LPGYRALAFTLLTAGEPSSAVVGPRFRPTMTVVFADALPM